jgi:thiazole synthase
LHEVPHPSPSHTTPLQGVLSILPDAAIAMELGADAVLMNSGIANAKNPELMAEAMKHGVTAGRAAYLAGRMARKLYATAGSPLQGVVR